MKFQDQGAPQGADSVLVAKWGLETMSLGYVAVPDVLLEEMGAFALTPVELVMLLQLMRYWWTPGQWPYPSKKTLAKAMNCTEKNAQKILARLEKLGYAKRVQNRRPGERSDANTYDMSGLVSAVAGLAEPKLAIRRRQMERESQARPHTQEQARQPWRDQHRPGYPGHGKKTLAASLHRIESPYPLPPTVERI